MIRNGRDGRLIFTDERERQAGVAPPEVRLMHPSGVTRHLASGTAITKGKKSNDDCHIKGEYAIHFFSHLQILPQVPSNHEKKKYSKSSTNIFYFKKSISKFFSKKNYGSQFFNVFKIRPRLLISIN